jgi:predicted metal-binding membrane protein
VILLYTRALRGADRAQLRTWAFVGGYLLAWSAFSLAATLLQWQLSRAALLSPMMQAASPAIGAALLIAAGAYQWTALKQSCLGHCRSPLEFITRHARPGWRGSLRLGAAHGAFCVGCCWALMLLLFAGGVMNLLWIAAISAFVLIEKLAPAGPAAGRWSGALLAACGFGLVLLR